MPRTRRRPTKWADPAKVRLAIAQMEEDFIHCRANGHAWSRTKRWVNRLPGGYFDQVIACDYCEGEKKQRINRRGQILRESRVYPEGYLLKGLGRVDLGGKAIFRLASLNAVAIDAEVEDIA